MADKSKIEWTDATWNPITGCSVVSPGCTNCYAMKLAGGRMQHHPSRAGLTHPSKAGPVWNGQVRFNEAWLDQPLRWKRPRTIFVCAHGDLFHEGVPDDWILRIWNVMGAAPQHRFQVLTKRSQRLLWFMENQTVIHKNVWMGVSVEDRARKDRIDELRDTPAAIRFLSLEPLLEDLGELDLTGIGWVIVGGEGGPNARPMHPAWARSIRDQCVAAGVPFFFKQWGEWIEIDGPRCRSIRQDREESDAWLDIDGALHPRTSATNRRFSVYVTSIVRRVGKRTAGRKLDGRTWDELPA